MGKISIDVRMLVVTKMNDGWSQTKVTDDLNISRRAIQNIMMKYRKHKSIENLPKSGCPPLNTERNVRLLIRDYKNNSKKTAPELLRDWKSSVPTSVTTVKRRASITVYRLTGKRT